MSNGQGTYIGINQNRNVNIFAHTLEEDINEYCKFGTNNWHTGQC